MKRIEVIAVDTGKGISAQALGRIEQGERILSFEKNFISYATNKTLRIDEHIHQISTDNLAIENFINHSCEPNAYIDFSTLELKALRSIGEGEEVTYNYFTSDWDGEDVFECECGSVHCKKHISGFKNLTPEEQSEIAEFISPFLARKMLELTYERSVLW